MSQLLEDLRLNPADLLPSLAHLGVVLIEVAQLHTHPRTPEDVS